MIKKVVLLVSLLAATQVYAQQESKGIDTKDIYFGAGLGFNDIGYGDDATGFQVFAGIPLPIKNSTVNLAVEAGYMDSGSFDKDFFGRSVKANGLWGTAVATLPVNNSVDLLARIGLDIGDDDGVMIGAGVGFKMSDAMDLRFEYVARDTIDSLQINLVIR